MKKVILTLFLITVFISLNAGDDKPNCGGKCTGSKYCGACKNCNYCKHCNSGGYCGVCRPDLFEEKKKAKPKPQAKKPKLKKTTKK